MQTALTLLSSCVPLVLFAAVLTSKWRFRWLVAAFYVGVYLLLSSQGQFLTVNGGGMDWRDYWAPRGLVEATTRNHAKRGRGSAELSWAGTGFWPLIVLDNAFWHRTHDSDLSK
jgi:hypothetical protein